VSDKLSWFKSVGLGAAQHAASVLLAGGLGDGANLWSLDYKQLGGLALGAAIASVLASIVAVPAPSIGKAAFLSVSTAAVQAAHKADDTAADLAVETAAELKAATPAAFVHDVHGARGA
jgi:hypothetical protein